MLTSPDVLSLTPNPTIDKSTGIENVAPDVKLRCEQPSFDPGGGGVNVARVLKRLGVDARLVYPAGGSHGDFLEDLLQEEGLDQTRVEIQGITRESFTVRETESGQQYRFSEPGPQVNENEWDDLMKQVAENLRAGTQYLVASGSLPPGVKPTAYESVGRLSREENARFVFDSSGDFLRKGLNGHPFLIKPNIRELGQLAGREIESDSVLVEEARSIVERDRSENVVVSLGAGGAYLINERGTYRFRAPTVPIDSKVGAGDSMVAGIVHGLLEFGDIVEAVQFGVAAGTAAVKTPGTELSHAAACRELHDRVEVKEMSV